MPAELETLTLDSFDGLNYRDPADELDPSETPRAMNVTIIGDGEGVAQRKGAHKCGMTGESGWPAWTAESKFKNFYVWEYTPAGYVAAASLQGDIYSFHDGFFFNSAPVQRYDTSSTMEWVFEPADSAAGASILWALGQGNGVVATPKKMGPSMVTSDWGGTPPQGRTLKYWRGRMIIGGVLTSTLDERIYFSKIGDPETWTAPDGGFIDLRTTADLVDPVMKLEVLRDELWVFRRHSIWRFSDPTTFTNERVFDQGVVNRYGVCRLGDRLYWIGDRGIYSTDGSSIVHETLGLEGVDPETGFELLTAYPFGLDMLAQFSRICATWKGRILWAIGPYIFEGYPDLRGQSGRIPWMRHRIPGVERITALAAMPTYIPTEGDDTQAFIGGDTVLDKNFLGTFGPVSSLRPYYCDYDYSANANKEILTEYWTPWIQADEVDKYIRVRKIMLLMGTLVAAGLEVNVDIYVDWDTSAPIATKSFSTASGPDRDLMDYWRPETRCRAFQLRFYTDNVGSSFKHWEIDRAQIRYRGRTVYGN